MLQEAAAVTAAYDRLGLLDGQVARDLQSQLKDYVRARVELYRMQHDFLLWQRMEDFSREQQNQLVNHKDQLWKAAVAACQRAPTNPHAGWCCQLSTARSRSLGCELVIDQYAEAALGNLSSKFLNKPYGVGGGRNENVP